MESEQANVACVIGRDAIDENTIQYGVACVIGKGDPDEDIPDKEFFCVYEEVDGGYEVITRGGLIFIPDDQARAPVEDEKSIDEFLKEILGHDFKIHRG